MIILNEEHWSGAKFSAIDRRNLRAGQALENRLVVAAQNNAGAVELAGNPLGLGRGAEPFRGQRRQQIPIHVISVCHRHLRLEAQAATEQARANGWRKVFHRFMAAGAGKEQNPKLRRPLIRCRHCRELPRLAQRATSQANER